MHVIVSEYYVVYCKTLITFDNEKNRKKSKLISRFMFYMDISDKRNGDCDH